MKEEGSVLVLVLFVIIIILTLISALTVVLGNEISMVSYNENRVKASYKAEAAIEEAFNAINDNPTISKDEIEIISGYEEDGIKGYEITNVVTPDDESNESGNYIITATGRAGKVEKEITVTISPTTTTDAKIVNAGGVIYKTYTKGGNTWETIIENDDYAENLSGGIVSIDEGCFDDYIDNHPEENSIIYNAAEEDNYSKSLSSEDINNLNTDIIYVKGDLFIIDKGNNNSINGGQDPMKIFVTGDLVMEGIRYIDNFIFIVLGDFQYHQPNANIDINNTFIYSGGSITFNKNKGKGNPTLAPHFEFSGKIVSQNDITILSKNGLVNKDYDLELPVEFSNLSTITLNKPKITAWKE